MRPGLPKRTAATELFATRGYGDTSVADILASAGVSRGALYHHFDGKEDLFAAVYTAVSSESVLAAGKASRLHETMRLRSEA